MAGWIVLLVLALVWLGSSYLVMKSMNRRCFGLRLVCSREWGAINDPHGWGIVLGIALGFVMLVLVNLYELYDGTTRRRLHLWWHRAW